jgi:putative transferase (TIGR04331 family)
MSYRPYFKDYNQGIIDKIKFKFPQIGIIEGGDVTQVYDDHRLIVVDHCTSNIGGLLTANKPCLFYWSKPIHKYTVFAENIFEILNKTGILHYTPESASDFTNLIYDKPEKWWNQQEVQEARKQFCQKLALTTENYIDSWIEEIGRNFHKS